MNLDANAGGQNQYDNNQRQIQNKQPEQTQEAQGDQAEGEQRGQQTEQQAQEEEERVEESTKDVYILPPEGEIADSLSPLLSTLKRSEQISNTVPKTHDSKALHTRCRKRNEKSQAARLRRLTRASRTQAASQTR